MGCNPFTHSLTSPVKQMHHLYSIALAIVLLVSPVAAQGVQGLATSSDTQTLPQDESALYVTIFNDGSSEAQTATAWFGTSLRSFIANARYNNVDCNGKAYRYKYADKWRGTCVAVTCPNGEVVSRIPYNEMPITDAALRERITEDCNLFRRRRLLRQQCGPNGCPAPQPPPLQSQPEPVKPQPEPVKPLKIEPSPIPNQRASMDLPIWVLLIAGIVGTLLGLAVSYHAQYKDR